MKQTFLDFEQPIAELQAKIDELRFVHEDSAVDIADEIARLSRKSQQLTKDIYAKLTAWQIAQAGVPFVAGGAPEAGGDEGEGGDDDHAHGEAAGGGHAPSQGQ